MKKQLLATLIGLSFAATTQAAPSTEEMWEIIQKQQAEISTLKNQLNKNDSRITETEIIAEATISAVEEISQAPAASNKTHIGGYGELHYNNLEKDDGSGDKDAVDFHRFVLFTSHQFSDSIRFFSELEVEHSIAGDGQVGEVELEQAYIEWDMANNKTAKAGLFLMPIGILNETHEPDTFYGTERNAVEKNIIPATWHTIIANTDNSIVLDYNSTYLQSTCGTALCKCMCSFHIGIDMLWFQSLPSALSCSLICVALILCISSPRSCSVNVYPTPLP